MPTKQKVEIQALDSHGQPTEGVSGYAAIHVWVNAHFTKTGACENCCESKRTCWSSVGHTYTRDRHDWQELCYSCHARLDKMSDSCRHGHLKSVYGRMRTDGKMHCNECARLLAERKRRAEGILPWPHRKYGDPSKHMRDKGGKFICAS